MNSIPQPPFTANTDALLYALLNGNAGTNGYGASGTLRLRHDVQFQYDMKPELVVTGTNGPGATVSYNSVLNGLQITAANVGDFGKARSRHFFATPSSGTQVIEFVTCLFHPEIGVAKVFAYGVESDETTSFYGITNGIALISYDNPMVGANGIALQVVSPNYGFVSVPLDMDYITSAKLMEQMKWRLEISYTGWSTRYSLYAGTSAGWQIVGSKGVVGDQTGGPYQVNRYSWIFSLGCMDTLYTGNQAAILEVNIYQVGPYQMAHTEKRSRNANSPVLFGTSGSKYAVHGVKMTATRFNQEVRLKEWYIAPETSTDRYIWEIQLNPTIGGAFAYAAVTGSSIEAAAGAAANTVSADGTVLKAGLAVGTTKVEFSDEDLNNMFNLGSSWGYTPDALVLVIIPLQNNSKFLSSVNVKEAL